MKKMVSSFQLKSSFKPKGSQPQAIKELVLGLKQNPSSQTLLGVTGSGKTFTIANVISQIQKPTLVLAHNKTLAAQLYNEFKELFPNNRVEFFVSYYDYYQPESYIPSRDVYIEKDAQVNPRIEQMRLSTTASLLSRKDVIVIASVSCIYNVGNPKDYKNMGFEIEKNKNYSRKKLLEQFINAQYQRNDMELSPGKLRVSGETIDFIPAYHTNIFRIQLFGNEIEEILELDKITGEILETYTYLQIYPAKHFTMPQETIKNGIKNIYKELKEVLPNYSPLEAHRLEQRTKYDMELIEEMGFCKGIENYSVYFDGRKRGQRPYCLLDYFPKDSLIVLDESHQTIPQIRGMYEGDKSRKKNLIDYGFRLPSALDNRPLTFAEFEKDFLKEKHTIFVSATPATYEIERSEKIVQQIIRPTGLVDPQVYVRPINGQINDLKKELAQVIKRGDRALLTTLTKKFAEELTEFLAKENIKTRYLHSEIDTLERTEIIRELRLGIFDVLVGINLLREGLDIPEVGFIGILDADKEGFLRDTKSLIQTIGRAARNINAYVVLYADKQTDSIKNALEETNRRRELQLAYNKKNNITPQTIKKQIKEKEVHITTTKHLAKKDIPKYLIELDIEMKKAAQELDFERAIKLREQIKRIKG
jgi:excinuclease ABC subunit B